MKKFKFYFTVSSLFFIAINSCSQNATKNPSILGIFVASTPCSEGTKPLPGIPLDADCVFIKWNLTLYQDEITKTPAIYKLRYVYGIDKPGSTGFEGGGNQVDMEGQWTISKGAQSNPNAIIYNLYDIKTNKTVSFLKLSDDLLHLLDNEQKLMVGTAAWSYTLNRIKNK